MIDSLRVLAIIPARGGSKGVPHKNIREVSGKPLITWTIEEARKSKYIDRLILSSDDLEIIEAAKACGCEVPFIRPNELAKDETPSIDVVMHALNMIPDYDIVVVLQVTSPLRQVTDIDGCIKQCINSGGNACVSVTQAEQSPYWMYTIDEQGTIHRLISTNQLITRRQELPPAYILNGAVYVAKTNWLRNSRTFLTNETLGFFMPKTRSLDIDTELDFINLNMVR